MCLRPSRRQALRKVKTCSRSHCRSYAFDGDAEACIIDDGGLEEGDGTSLAFVRLDLGEGNA